MKDVREVSSEPGGRCSIVGKIKVMVSVSEEGSMSKHVQR